MSPSDITITGLSADRRPAETAQSEISRRIKTARVLCVFFVVFGHINPGVTDQDFAAHGFRAFDYVRTFLVDVMGGGGARLLCIIAGFLLIESLSRRSFEDLVVHKIKTLIAPLVAWNSLYFLMIAAIGLIAQGYWSQKFSGLDGLSWAHVFFPFIENSINAPVSFFRDLFVAILLTPVLLPLVRRAPVTLLAVLFAAYLLGIDYGHFFIRNYVLAFFAAGLVLAVHRPSLGAFDRYFWVILPMTLVAGLLDVLAHRDMAVLGGPVPPLLDRSDVFAVFAIWWLAGAAERVSIARCLRTWEPYVFTVFCGHMIFSTLLWGPWKSALGGYYHPLYPVFFAVTPLLCFLMAFAFVEALGRASPHLLALFTGGRSQR